MSFSHQLLPTPYPDQVKRAPMFWVYFISAGGPVKIGKAINVRKRLAHFQTAHKAQLKILGAFRELHYNRTETAIHGMFQNFRLRGEWFQRTPELITFIKENDEFYKRPELHLRISTTKKVVPTKGQPRSWPLGLS